MKRKKLMRQKREVVKFTPNFLKDFKQEILRICVHESGHLVIARALLVPIVYSEINIRHDPIKCLIYHIGKSQFLGLDEGLLDPLKKTETIRKIIAINMGGMIAEVKFFGFDRPAMGSQIDLEGIRKLIDEIPNGIEIANKQSALAIAIMEENIELIRGLALKFADRLNAGNNPVRLPGSDILRLIEEKSVKALPLQEG